MNNNGVVNDYKKRIDDKLSENKLDYIKINKVLDCYITILIEEITSMISENDMREEAKKLLLYCLESIQTTISLFNDEKIVIGFCQTREIFETFISALALISDDSFKLSIDTETKECRNKVKDNSKLLFGELEFDEYRSFNGKREVHEFNAFYEWLSKIEHPTTLKLYLIELQNDKKASSKFLNLAKENLLYIILLLLFHLEKENKPTEENRQFRSSIINATTAIHYINIINFIHSIGRKKISNYKNFFLSENDKKFIVICSDNVKKAKKILDNNLKIKNAFNFYDDKIVKKVIIEKNYEQHLNLKV